MSDTVEKANDQKSAPAAVATSQNRPVKSRIKFLSVTNFHNLKREEIYKYILRLHKRIRMLIKKCRRYRNKVAELVS